MPAISRPDILAPAGSKPAFLSAIAAGADAVYCGLKTLSARMAAINFTVEELVPLVGLAHEKGVKVFITLNSLLKPSEIGSARDTITRLSRFVQPDALIIQDLALISLAKETGYTGELHLSTLANVTFPKALSMIQREFPVDRIVLPRELNVDEIKMIAQSCPKELGLEVFIHGALCFGISGRCYWSSFMGGKSGLRGRCVQPCRRRYRVGQEVGRFFSCQDLSIDVLCKVLLTIPEIRCWKIEGRRKGPHYVYYTVEAYRLLRDEGTDPQAKKTALAFLAQALGRSGTHYNFLPQRPQNPVNLEVQTGSGLVIGKCQGPRTKPYLIPREALFPGDLLRTGYEDDAGHSLHKVQKYVPKRGRYTLKVKDGKGPEPGTPVFLVDRLEAALSEKIKVLEGLLKHPSDLPRTPVNEYKFQRHRPRRAAPQKMVVSRKPQRAPDRVLQGYWLTSETLAATPKAQVKDIYWWLPPVVWPTDEKMLSEQVEQALQSGGSHFVLNAPWQISFFNSPFQFNLWAGPFCNITNPVAIACLPKIGMSGIIIAPELGEKDLLFLPEHSPVPMGMVVSGHWPLSIARAGGNTLRHGESYISPKGEQAWISRYGSEDWVFPNWKIDLTEKIDTLRQAGYRMFIDLVESIPHGISLRERPGLWNWELDLS